MRASLIVHRCGGSLPHHYGAEEETQVLEQAKARSVVELTSNPGQSLSHAFSLPLPSLTSLDCQTSISLLNREGCYVCSDSFHVWCLRFLLQ